MASRAVAAGIALAALGGFVTAYSPGRVMHIVQVAGALAVGGAVEAPAPLMPPLPDLKVIRGLYITAAIAQSDKMDGIIGLIKDAPEGGAPNAVVIDIQNEAGRVLLDDRMKALVRRLRFLNIMPIARLVVFQNNNLAEEKSAWAIHTEEGGLWRDKGGRRWLDPSNKDAWEHVAGVARQAVAYGFGEINLDYFRFPSEGVTTAVYPFWKESELKTDIIKNAAVYLRDAVKKDHPEVKVTADIFGYTFMRRYDLGIGQSAPALAAALDAVYPMIYPSHYDPGNFNFENPADHPYEVMFQTLQKGKEIFEEAHQPFTNIRPWIQDFNMGAVYTPEMVQAQMKAASDAGLESGWLIWNPHNTYRAALFEY